MAVITLVEALGFRSLRRISQPLGEFVVLAGPHGSGKTAFLDVIRILGRLVSAGPEAAIAERCADFRDLVWMRFGRGFELAVEARIPEARRALLHNPDFQIVRYEVSLGLAGKGGQPGILEEKLLFRAQAAADEQTALFPPNPATILTAKGARSVKTVVHKNAAGNDNFYDENGKGWDHAFRLGPRRAALATLPDDEAKFPVSTWLLGLLAEGIRSFEPKPTLIARPTAPGEPAALRPDAANLSWAIECFANGDPAGFANWLARLRTAVPEIESVRVMERQEDRHRYFVLKYRSGFEAPCWMASDGTLRLIALTLGACVPGPDRVWLIERPENGIDPEAIEPLFDALAASPAQVIMTTHSPAILARVPRQNLLRFTLTPAGETKIALAAQD